MMLASAVGVYVPIVIVAFVVFVLLVRRSRGRVDHTMRDGEGQRLDF